LFRKSHRACEHRGRVEARARGIGLDERLSVSEIGQRRSGRRVLLVVLPYRLGDATTDASKKAIRSFLAFPYGVLTLASYVRRFANGLERIEILDLNLPSEFAPDLVLKRKLDEIRPDIVGFSMSYDVSFGWLKSLAGLVKKHDVGICVVAGGPAITTAYAEILAECEQLDAACYSEGEVGLKNLIEAGSPEAAI